MKKAIGIIALVLIAAVFIIIGFARKGSSRNERRIAVIPKGTSSVFWESVHAGAEKAGEEFGEVDLPGPDRGRGGAFTTGWPPKKPNKKLGPMTGYTTPGSGPTGPETMLGFDGRYVNDNSPGSAGVGVPEVEGGDDTSTQNDIVDGTVTGKDLDIPLTMIGDTYASLLACSNSLGDAITVKTFEKNSVGVRAFSAAKEGVACGVRAEVESVDAGSSRRWRGSSGSPAASLAPTRGPPTSSSC